VLKPNKPDYPSGNTLKRLPCVFYSNVEATPNKTDLANLTYAVMVVED
jgi:hypothetical protein